MPGPGGNMGMHVTKSPMVGGSQVNNLATGARDKSGHLFTNEFYANNLLVC